MAVGKSAEHSPAGFSITPLLSSPDLEASAIEGSPEPPGRTETPVSASQEGYQGVDLDAGRGAQRTFGNPPEPQTAIQGNADVLSAVTASTLLPLQCRMCDALPTVGMRPTVTMCGHLFCSKYALKLLASWTFKDSPVICRCITQHVMSTPRCPVCDNALLLYCLFKLDLPVAS